MLVSFSLLIIPVYAPQESNTVRLFPTDDTFVVDDNEQEKVKLCKNYMMM